MQAQPPAGALAAFAAAGALKTESCLSTALPWHCGQVIFSRDESTMLSKSALQPRQRYSNIGMDPRLYLSANLHEPSVDLNQAPCALVFFCLTASRSGLSCAIGSRALISKP